MNQQDYYLNALGIEKWVERAQIDTWENLRQEVSACTACGLEKTRTQTVFGVGNLTADLLVIGEAPGFHEDQQGEPFVGRAGKLLDAMLMSIGEGRHSIFIANILKCRPPNNRDPDIEEVKLCTPFLLRQIALLKPKIILAVGRIAAHFLLNTSASMRELRGGEFFYGADKVPLIVTYHPAYLLRSPGDKAKAWEDLMMVKDKLNKIVG
jgi:DNA polymerase